MKELYISPELEILCFMPFEGIATANIDVTLPGGSGDDGLSFGETTRADDYNEDVNGDPLT